MFYKLNSQNNCQPHILIRRVTSEEWSYSEKISDIRRVNISFVLTNDNLTEISNTRTFIESKWHDSKLNASLLSSTVEQMQHSFIQIFGAQCIKKFPELILLEFSNATLNSSEVADWLVIYKRY